MRTYIFPFLFALLLSGCQKAEDNLPGYAEPVFGVNLKGLPVSSISAGVDSYYMFTRYSTENQLFTTSGTLGLESCDNGICPNSLRFELRLPIGTADFGVDSIFHPGEYPFIAIGGDSIVYQLTLRATPHEPVDSVIWIIDQTYKVIGDTAVLDFPLPTSHTVVLQTIKNGSIRSKVTGNVDVSGQASYPLVGIRAGYDTVGFVSGYNIQAVSIAGPLITDYAWSNDSISSSYFDSGFGVSQGAINLTATDAQGQVATAALYQLDMIESFRKTTDFVYDSSVVNLGVPEMPHGVAIQWIDADGFVWRSDWGNQLPDQLFAILSSEVYDNNELGQKTRKLHIAFKCRLYNNLGQIMSLEGAGWIGMAHP